MGLVQDLISLDLLEVEAPCNRKDELPLGQNALSVEDGSAGLGGADSARGNHLGDLIRAENRILVEYGLVEHAQKSRLELLFLGRCDAQAAWGSGLARLGCAASRRRRMLVF